MLPANPIYETREEQIVFEVARALLKLFWIATKWLVLLPLVLTIFGVLLVATLLPR